MSKFIESAASRETSVELMESIERVAVYYGIDPDQVWSDPTSEQLTAIVADVMAINRLNPSDLYWGAAGNEWAE